MLAVPPNFTNEVSSRKRLTAFHGTRRSRERHRVTQRHTCLAGTDTRFFNSDSSIFNEAASTFSSRCCT
jgi:hypothetical protein